MRKILLTAMVAAIAPGLAAATELTVTVSGVGPVGEVRGMLFRDADTFDRREGGVAKFALIPENGRVVARIADLPPGRYAIASYQDRNGNQKLDTSLFGIPTEPYGFSNDASAPFGPPAFDVAAFTLSEGEAHAVTVILR